MLVPVIMASRNIVGDTPLRMGRAIITAPLRGSTPGFASTPTGSMGKVFFTSEISSLLSVGSSNSSSLVGLPL